MNAKRFSKNCKNQWNGKKNNELYAIYNAMHQRCENKKSTGYPYYGARGIKICDLWNRKNPDGFKNFCEYVGNRPSQDHSIDRINNDGDYEPGNVRWSTIKEQLQNRRELPKNRKVFVDEPPGKFGNWTFKGEVVRVIDAKGRWFRYYKVICGLCNTEHLVIKQSLKNGKSTKCLECARKALYNLNGMKRAEKT
jgi:hypothetical protein